VSKPAAPPYLVGSGFSLAAVDPGDTGPGNKQAAVEDSDRLRRRLTPAAGAALRRAPALAAGRAAGHRQLDHDFLWRYHRRAPGRGLIGVFNRSHYEDVLVARVKQLAPEAVWRPRYAAINAFEAQLTAAGTTVVKFFLHISRDEQRRRLESRLADPDKRWKFSVADLAERERWDAYQSAFDEALRRCSTADAPWWVVLADHKWARNRAVLGVLVDTLETMDPRFPLPAADLDRVVVPR